MRGRFRIIIFKIIWKRKEIFVPKKKDLRGVRRARKLSFPKSKAKTPWKWTKLWTTTIAISKIKKSFWHRSKTLQIRAGRGLSAKIWKRRWKEEVLNSKSLLLNLLFTSRTQLTLYGTIEQRKKKSKKRSSKVTATSKECRGKHPSKSWVGWASLEKDKLLKRMNKLNNLLLKYMNITQVSAILKSKARRGWTDSKRHCLREAIEFLEKSAKINRGHSSWKNKVISDF